MMLKQNLISNQNILQVFRASMRITTKHNLVQPAVIIVKCFVQGELQGDLRIVGGWTTQVSNLTEYSYSGPKRPKHDPACICCL